MSKRGQSEIESPDGLMNRDALTKEGTDAQPICEDDAQSNEVKLIQAHGDRLLVMRRSGTGLMIGHVDRVPYVNITDMSADPERDSFHAYGIRLRKGKRGIPHSVTHRLGEFNSHDEAVAAVKKFHKIK